MRLLFFGSGAFGLPTLQSLCDRHEVVQVISQPDKPAGRKRALTPTPIAQWALEQGYAVPRAENVNTPEFVEQIKAYNADASIVIAFGQKLGPELIDAMGKLAVNLHASLLPKYRGAAPINWAMIDNEPVTGNSVIALAQKMDAGVVYATNQTPIDPNETAGELHDRLSKLGPGVINQVLQQLAEDTLTPMTQDESLASKARKFTKADGTVSFDQPAAMVRARIHGLTPWPGCRVRWIKADGQDKGLLTLKRVADESIQQPLYPGVIDGQLRVTCADDGVVKLSEIQAPGGKAMSAEDFARGQGLEQGDRFESL
ncbi:MAG: methionyl-tRNA formyltransferase [Phycisphaeraceae bacterium]|nr:methionyl-tRNA formyltransferase [Phycisphaeraceae bacterium]